MDENVSYYSLNIWVSEENFHKIDEILGVKTNQGLTTWWILELVPKEGDEYINFVDYFLSLLG